MPDFRVARANRGIRSARLFAQSANIPHSAKAATDLWLPQIRLRFRNFRGFTVCMAFQEDELLVVCSCCRGIFGGGCGLAGAIHTTEAIRVRRKRLLIGYQGLRGSIELQKQVPKKLANPQCFPESRGACPSTPQGHSLVSTRPALPHPDPARARAWRSPLSAGPRFDRPSTCSARRDRHGPIAVAQSPSGRERRLLSEPRQALAHKRSWPLSRKLGRGIAADGSERFAANGQSLRSTA